MTTPDQVRMGVLRVLTLGDPTAVSHHGRVIERHFPHVSTTSECIPDHPNGIPDVETEEEARPYVEDLGREMAADVDVLGVSCALDPAVDSLDAELDVPVVGAGASVAGAALARGENVGTLGLESGRRRTSGRCWATAWRPARSLPARTRRTPSQPTGPKGRPGVGPAARRGGL